MNTTHNNNLSAHDMYILVHTLVHDELRECMDDMQDNNLTGSGYMWQSGYAYTM